MPEHIKAAEPGAKDEKQAELVTEKIARAFAPYLKDEWREEMIRALAGYLKERDFSTEQTGDTVRMVYELLGIKNVDYTFEVGHAFKYLTGAKAEHTFRKRLDDYAAERLLGKLERLLQPKNLTSDHNKGSSEVRLLETSGLNLRREGLANGADSLPFLVLLGNPGFLIEGWSHIIAGYPKVGKTELMTSQCLCWERSILYLTEESQDIWRARIARLPDSGLNERKFTFWLARLKMVFGLGASPEALLNRIATGKEEIVIIDTVRNLLNLHDEKDNTEIARVLSPFIAAAREKGKTIIFLHHIRKGGGEHGEGIAGGHAFLGVVDIALELLRDPKASKRRLLRGLGRIITVPEIMYEQLDNGEFRCLGNPEDVEFSQVKERALSIVDDEWRKVSDIHDRFDDPKPSEDQLRKALNSLAKDRD